MKYINLKEFRDLGYLQELNRRFLHPLGFAIAVDVKHDKVTFSGIIDARDQEDGYIFDERYIDAKREEFEDKAMFVQGEMERRCTIRKEKLGYDIQPIIKIDDERQLSVPKSNIFVSE